MIDSFKHASVDEVLQHWKQFLEEVTEELLKVEHEAQEEQLRRLAAAGQQWQCEVDKEKGLQSLPSPAETVSSVCRWCSCCYDAADLGCPEASASADAAPTTEGAAVGDAVLLPGLELAASAAPSAGSISSRAVPFAASASNLPGVPCCARQPSASELRIMQLVNRYSYETKFVALLNPGVLYNLMGRNLETGLPQPYTDQHWHNVVQQLGLSKHQVSHIVAFANVYFNSVDKLLVDRKVLQQQLRIPEGLAAGCCSVSLSGHADGDGGGVENAVIQLQALDKLSSNLKREHVLRIMLNCFVLGRSLNCTQFARLAVHSHPFFPDVHAIVCVIYEDAQAPPAGQQAMENSPHHHEISLPVQQQDNYCHHQHESWAELQAVQEQLRLQAGDLGGYGLLQQLQLSGQP
eukprot:gene1595-1935_t